MGLGSSTEIRGVRVFKVTPSSPAAEAGLEAFFDFIVEVNGTRVDDSELEQAFASKIKEAEGTTAKLKVYSSKSQSVRDVAVVPRRWTGPGLLGATVRYDAAEASESQGIRVLDVFPNSPAHLAGLEAYQDFLLGTPQMAFHEIDDLADVLDQNLNKKVQVSVYNVVTELVREVVLEPNESWGGEGRIGCGTGTGLLHRIPAPRRGAGHAGPTAVAPPLTALPNGVGPAVAPPLTALPNGVGATSPPQLTSLPVGVGSGVAPPAAGIPNCIGAAPAAQPVAEVPNGAGPARFPPVATGVSAAAVSAAVPCYPPTAGPAISVPGAAPSLMVAPGASVAEASAAPLATAPAPVVASEAAAPVVAMPPMSDVAVAAPAGVPPVAEPTAALPAASAPVVAAPAASPPTADTPACEPVAVPVPVL